MEKIAETAEFVGRRSEIDKISRLLDKVADGEGQVIFVSGEAGIGKTRLLNEIQSEPIGQKFTWLTARCFYSEGADPYLPFTDALKSWFGYKSEAGAKPVEEAEEITVKEPGPKELSEIPVIGQKLAEEPDAPYGAFMIKEPKSELSLSAFSTLLSRGGRGLCITRIPPQKLGDLAKHEGNKVYWLSKKPGEFCIPPSLTKLSHEILRFVKNNPNSVVLMDGLEYIVVNNEFKQVLRFMNELVDSMALHKSIMLIPMDPLTIEKKQMALLERDMTTIDMLEQDKITKAAEKYRASPEKTGAITKENLKNGRDRMFETIAQEVLDIAATKPVVLFIDDIHWADIATLHLLHYLARAVRNKPVAILSSFRPEELVDSEKSHPTMDLINRMMQEKLVMFISLDRFNKRETSDMIGSLLHKNKYQKELGNLIHKETEGNPFFIEEMLRSMEEGEVISFNEPKSSWALMKKIPEISVPDTIKDVVMARTDRLDKKIRRVLESASVLGVEFDYDILASITDIDENQLVTYLDDLIHIKLVTELPCGLGEPICYRFMHNKICEVLYDGINQSRKRLLHKFIAKAYSEKYAADLDSVTYELAQHSYLGNDYRNALQYSMKAGEKALIAFAPEKAKMFYSRALKSIELIETRPSETVSNKLQQAEIYLKLSDIGIIIGEWDEALKYTNDLLKFASELEDNWKQVDAHINAGKIHMYRSSWTEANEHFDKALELAQKSNYDDGLLEAHFGLGGVHERLGEYTEAMEHFQHFMEMALPMNSLEDIAKGYKAFAMISTQRGDFNTSMEYYKKCIELLSKTDNISELAKAYTGIGVTYFELGEYKKVIESHEKCIELSSKIGNIRLKGYGYSNAAEAYVKIKELDKALEYTNTALEIFTKLDEKPMIGLVWMNFGIIYRSKKEYETSRDYFEKSISALKEQNVPYYLADCTRQFGLMLAELGLKGAQDESRECLEEALDLYKTLGAAKYIDVVTKELEDLKK